MFSLSFTLVAIALSLVYFYVLHVYSYWQRHGVPHLKPSIPFGNLGKIFLQKMPSRKLFQELYRKTTEPFIGIYVLYRPILFIRDPKLASRLLITDFQFFADRGMYVDEQAEPLSAHLGALPEKQWRDMRSKLSPVFTACKLKMIFPALLDCSKQLQKHLSNIVTHSNNDGTTVDLRETVACFAGNVIASVGFGVDVDCFANPKHPFRETGRRVFELSMKWKGLVNGLRMFGWVFHPTLLKWSRLGFMDREAELFFFDLVVKTLEMREKHNVMRKDVFQLLVELRNNNGITMDDEWKTTTTTTTTTVNSKQKSLTLKQLTANVFSFYIGGFETSASVITVCLFEIAKHPNIQQKVHEEIDRVLARHNGELTYESINELDYLDCCISGLHKLIN